MFVHKYMYNDCVRIKSKYLKQFNYKFEKSPECEFADFIRNNINEIKDLYLECCFADNLRLLTV